MNSKKPSLPQFSIRRVSLEENIDYKKRPEKYKVGKGEQGVLICEPYKSEIGQYWRFKNAEIAQESAEKIFFLFLTYLEEDDFVGADMARKYLQMGFTRARRYFNYKGGKKYDAEQNHQLLERGTGDPEKARSADIFYREWRKAEDNMQYARMKTDWKEKFG